MILEKGDMWSIFGKTRIFLITTNFQRNAQGLAVMGRGIANEAALRFPEIREDFAKRLEDSIDLQAYDDALHPVYTGIIGKYDGQVLGWFMTKRHWKDPSTLDIIRDSVRELKRWQDIAERIDLNFPGIGNGKLKREDVLPIIEQLPDNVHVWERE